MKTHVALIVKEDGLIYVNEVPEEPQICMSYVLGHCLLTVCSCHDLQKAYERQLASAKENAVLCADQEQAKRLIKQEYGHDIDEMNIKTTGYQYQVPVEWEEKVYFTRDGKDVDTKVAILKESTPSTEQEKPFNGCSPTACGCKSLADCPNNQPQITVMGQGFRFKKFSLLKEEPRSVATDKTELKDIDVTQEESQEELWMSAVILVNQVIEKYGAAKTIQMLRERYSITRNSDNK